MRAAPLRDWIPRPWCDGRPVLDPLPILLDLIGSLARQADSRAPRRSSVRAAYKSAIRCVLRAESNSALRALSKHHHRIGANYLASRALQSEAIQRLASAHLEIARVLRRHLEQPGDATQPPISTNPDESHEP